MFESVLEKIGRIIARNYGIEVLCQGDMACTDGKKIFLPAIKNLDQETKELMHGFLDHETAHIRFTTFPEIAKCLNSFHKNFLNAIEDERIEIEMIKELPGTKLNLDKINDKYGNLAIERRRKGELPWPHRFIMSMRDIMAGTDYPVESDIKEMVDSVKDLALTLKDAKSTKELREISAAILKKLAQDKEEEKDENQDGDSSSETGDGEESEEKGESGKGSQSEEESEESGESGDSESSEESEEESEEESDGSGESEESESEEEKSGSSDSKSDSSEPSGEEKIEEACEILDINPMDDLEDAFNKDLEGLVKEEGRSGRHLPSTTQFDEETDLTGKGNSSEYAKIKKEAKPLVAGLRKSLERILKVKENAKWRVETERGQLNRASLAKMASDRNYNKVFKQYQKTETNNVAVQILIDESGSMHGNRIAMARLAAVAMSEALNDLQIPFEVTGFTSKSDRKMQNFTRELQRNGTDTSRFNRKSEILVKNVYKGFNSNNLTGLSNINASQQNPDGEAVRWAANRLSKQKQNRKILIVMSDGMPATGEGDHRMLNRDLSEAVKEIRKYGIETVGMGIQSNAVKQFYPDHIVINDISELPKECMRKLAKIIGA